jgi:hypothetical protein
MASVIPLVITAALTSACGGSARTALSQAEFRNRADAACTQAKASLQALPSSRASAPYTAASTLRLLTDAQPIAASMIRHLTALIPPEQDQALWAKYLRAARAQQQSLADALRAAEFGDLQATKRAVQAVATHDAHLMAMDLGLTVCAKNALTKGG